MHMYTCIYVFVHLFRWTVVSAVANEISHLCEEGSEIYQNADVPKHMISLVEVEAFNAKLRIEYIMYSHGRCSHRTVTDYHDTRVGHIKSKHAYSNLKSLRKNGEDKLRRKDDNTGKVSERNYGHNKHFRGIQRKEQMIRKSRRDLSTEQE